MFFRKNKKSQTEDDETIINSMNDNKGKEMPNIDEVLEYFAPYADLSDLGGPSPVPSQTDLFANDEPLKEQEAKILADNAKEEERKRLACDAEEVKKRRAEEAERKRLERVRKKNSFFNRFKKGFDNISGELFGSEDTSDTLEAGPTISTYDADKAFTFESRQLMKEVAERIDLLRQMGVNIAVLEQLIQQPLKLSRLVITKDYDIILPDYHHMEIKMAPLIKAVFILFLRHPEGIIFKHLPDYRNELWDIYYMLKDGMVSESHRKSIDDVTDPFNNSINEKCARIREAFVSKFDERLACHYYVDGRRGEAKKIDLPRDLVIWE